MFLNCFIYSSWLLTFDFKRFLLNYFAFRNVFKVFENCRSVGDEPSKLGNLVQGWILCHLLGILIVFLPMSASKIGYRIFNLETDDAVTIGIVTYCLVGAWMIFKQKDAFGQDWKLVKCLALLEISALVFSMCLCNFSLAYIITLIYVPIGKFFNSRN